MAHLLLVAALVLLPGPFVPRRSHVSPPAIAAVARKSKRISGTNRKHALEKRETQQEEERRVARAASEAREAAQAAERTALRNLMSDEGGLTNEREAVQILRRMGRAGLLPDDRATAMVLGALVAGSRSSPRHRLVVQVAALCRVYPPEGLEVEQAAAFLRSAAALRQARATPPPRPPSLARATRGPPPTPPVFARLRRACSPAAVAERARVVATGARGGRRRPRRRRGGRSGAGGAPAR